MKQLFYFSLVCLIILTSCNTIEQEVIEKTNSQAPATKEKSEEDSLEHHSPSQPIISLKEYDRKATEWGENVTGVKTRFISQKKEIALTFDACGGDHGNAFDEQLISFLRQEAVPATLFINERWIKDNQSLFLQLAADPLFQIENHGTKHAPLSVDGGEAWGIPATDSVQAVYDEIMTNHETVKQLTGKEMTLFRSGTAYYDEVAVELAEALGYTVVNFDILGDAGASFTSQQVKEALLTAQAGSIVLLHMNQPTSGTADGVKEAIPILKEQGFEFVQLKNKALE